MTNDQFLTHRSCTNRPTVADHRCPWLIWLKHRGRILVHLVQSTTRTIDFQPKRTPMLQPSPANNFRSDPSMSGCALGRGRVIFEAMPNFAAVADCHGRAFVSFQASGSLQRGRVLWFAGRVAQRKGTHGAFLDICCLFPLFFFLRMLCC